MSKEFNNVLNDFFKNYQDRGMKKWQGLMLSDHTAAINRSKLDLDKVYVKKKTMTQEEASELLMYAYANHKIVSVQLKELDADDNVQPDIEGVVEGYNIDDIIVSGMIISLDNINHVDIEWWRANSFTEKLTDHADKTVWNKSCIVTTYNKEEKWYNIEA